MDREITNRGPLKAPCSLSTNLNQRAVDLPALFAIAPPIALFLVSQRWIVRGVLLTGIKG